MIALLTLEQNHALNMCFAPPQKSMIPARLLRGIELFFFMHRTHCRCHSSHFLL